jgi:formylglycine-generating enzyme required for sulfatase activity
MKNVVARAVLVCALAAAAGGFALHPAFAEERFQDCESCPEMVVIPPGRVVVGMPRGLEQRFAVPLANQKRGEPVTEVMIRYSFAVSRFEITRKQFETFVSETNYKPPHFEGCWEGYGRPEASGTDARRNFGRPNRAPELNWTNPGFPQAPDHPIVCVSYDDTLAYLQWLSNKTGKQYRLLSESEWNYVASEGTKTAWPWGDEPTEACKHGNFSDLTRAVAEHLLISRDNVFQCFDGFTHTSPVGSFPPNKFGVFDIMGNAAELTADCFLETLEKMPYDGSPYLDGRCKLMTAKGGSWDLFPYSTLTGYRGRFDTGENERYTYYGIRVAVTVNR